MPLEATKVPVQFRGLETKLDPRAAVVGDLVLLENARFDNPPKIQKRFGKAKIGQATAGVGASTYKDQLVVQTGFRIQAFTPSGMLDKGCFEPLALTTKTVSKSAYTAKMPDGVVHPGGFSVYAWESTEAGVTVVRYSTFDNATGQPIVSGGLVGVQGRKPKVVAFRDDVVISYLETSGALANQIVAVSVPAASPGVVSAPTSFAGDVKMTANGLGTGISGRAFDLAVVGNYMILVYVNTGGDLSGRKIDYTLTPSAATIFLAYSPPLSVNAVTVFSAADGSHFWVGYTLIATPGGGPGYVGGMYRNFDLTANLNSSAAVASNQILNVCGADYQGNATFFYEQIASALGWLYGYVLMGTFTVAGGTLVLPDRGLGVGVYHRCVGLASKPFFYGGIVHVLLARETPLQTTYFLCAGANADVVCRFATGIGGGTTGPTQNSRLPEVSSIVDSVFTIPYLQVSRLESVDGAIVTQTGAMAATVDFAATPPSSALASSLEIGESLLLAGGIMALYDGGQVAENGFHHYPEGATATAGTPGALSYRICATYEWTDANGVVHQSAPSAPVEVLAAAGSAFNYVVPCISLTSKKGPISIAIWRTMQNQPVFFRVTDLASPLLNVFGAGGVSFSESLSDATLAGKAQLVFNPLNSLAEVAPMPADPALFVTRYRNRAVYIPAEAPGQWAFSKSVNPGTPVEFNPQQFYNPVQGGGPRLVGLIEMDDKLILFSKDRIWWASGDGPAPNGTGSDYSNAFNIPTDVGCSNARSLLLTPDGVIFQSQKGLYLLDRGLNVKYFGSSVEAFNTVPITSASILNNSQRLVFTLDKNTGRALVYDSFVQKWSVWTNYGASDACVFQDLLTTVYPDGSIHQEAVDLFTDAGSAEYLKFRTSWLSFAGLSGYQRVWRFTIRGDYRGAHRLKVSVAYDDNPIPAQEILFTPSMNSPVGDTTVADTDNPGDGEYAVYEYTVKLLKEKCSSIQITIEEVLSGATGTEGFTVSGLTFLAGLLPGLHKTPASRVIS